MKIRLELVLGLFVFIMVSSYVYVNFGSLIGIAGITGNQIMSTRLVIISKNETVCDMDLEEGWNLVSFPCISDDLQPGIFMAPFNSTYRSIRSYSVFDPNDPWKSYNPNLPEWVVQDLTAITRRNGYFLDMGNKTYVYINSSLATPTLIDMVPGWNMIGYPSRSIRKANDTFDQLIPNFDYVYLYNASDQSDPWKQYTWNTSLPSDQDLGYAVLYYGYWVYMISPDTMVIS